MISVNPSRDFSCKGHDDCDDVPSSFALPVLKIVIIVILNDGTIISITYDNVTVSKKPEKWNLNLLYVISVLLGFIAYISSIGTLLLALDHMNEDEPNSFWDAFGIKSFSYGQVMTVMFFKVSITLFSARTESWFWSRTRVGITLIMTTLLSFFWILNVRNYNTKIPPMKSLDVVEIEAREDQLGHRDLIYCTTCGQNCIFDTLKRFIKESAVLPDRSCLQICLLLMRSSS